jgi:hypothetical protein
MGRYLAASRAFLTGDCSAVSTVHHWVENSAGLTDHWRAAELASQLAAWRVAWMAQQMVENLGDWRGDSRASRRDAQLADLTAV